MSADQVARQTAIWATIRCKEEGMANRDVAKFVPYSREWVRTRWNEYQKDGKHREKLAKVEEVIA